MAGQVGTGAEALVVFPPLVAILMFLVCQAGWGWGDGQIVADLQKLEGLGSQMGRWGGGLGGSHQAEAAVRVPSVAAVQALAGPQAPRPAGSRAQTVQNLT